MFGRVNREGTASLSIRVRTDIYDRVSQRAGRRGEMSDYCERAIKEALDRDDRLVGEHLDKEATNA